MLDLRAIHALVRWMVGRVLLKPFIYQHCHSLTATLEHVYACCNGTINNHIRKWDFVKAATSLILIPERTLGVTVLWVTQLWEPPSSD
jgi:hypothetical protein